MNKENKLCPFCGSDDLHNASKTVSLPSSGFFVICGNCFAEGPLGETRKEAWEKWNKRSDEMTGVELIAKERQRQIKEKGYNNDIKDNPNEELAFAAVCYATPTHRRVYNEYDKPVSWPWGKPFWNPTPDNRIRELVKAGALIAAEIDRLQALEKENDKHSS